MEGRRKKGRPKLMWMDNGNVDLMETRLSGEKSHNRTVWKKLVRNIRPCYRWEICSGRRIKTLSTSADASAAEVGSY